MTVASGREFLMIPGPTTVPDEVLAAMHRPAIDIYSGALVEVTTSCVADLRRIFGTDGRVYVYAATDAPNFSKVLKSTLKELREVKKQGVTQDELKRSKDHLKGSLMLSLESTSSRMNRLAKHELHFGSFLTLDQMLRAIDVVKHDEVQALVAELLDEAQIALTTLGPLDRRNLPAELR